MAMNVGSSGDGEDEVVSTINTTPLVDVMLVLLIIFLITIPVVTQTVPAEPAQRDQHRAPDQAREHRDLGQQGRRRVLERATGGRQRGAVPAAEEDRGDDAAARSAHSRR